MAGELLDVAVQIFMPISIMASVCVTVILFVVWVLGALDEVFNNPEERR